MEFIKERTDNYNRTLFDDDGSNSAMYIIISQNTRRELQMELNNLIGNQSQAVFIAPHFKDKEVVLDEFVGNAVEWEVSHNAKG